MDDEPQTNDLDGVSGDDIAQMEERWNRWKKPLLGTGVFIFLIAFYIFVYPLILCSLASSHILDNCPDSIAAALEYSVKPLQYLSVNFESYETYFHWLEKLFDL